MRFRTFSRFKKKFIPLCVIPLLLSGCFGDSENKTPDTNPTKAESSATASLKDTFKLIPLKQDAKAPIDYAALKEDSVVQLVNEPRIINKHTLVGIDEQRFSLRFRERMNRPSVETAVQNNLNKTDNIDVKLTFEWVSDTECIVTAKHQELTKSENPYPVIGQYTISTKQSKTLSGKQIKHAKAEFDAVLDSPAQLWRVSVDGKTIEQISHLKQPYQLKQNIDNRYILASRYVEYCECDADLPTLDAIYDIGSNEFTLYSSELTTNYRGEGTFIADSRGFFITKSPTIPEHLLKDTVEIQIPEFIHGASFSKNKQYVLAAVGTKEQKKDFDLLIYHLKTKEKQTFPKALIGEPYLSEVSSTVLPLKFLDDGNKAYISMRTPNHYQYDWNSKQISRWEHMKQELEYYQPEFIDSADRKFRLDDNIVYNDKQEIVTEIPLGTKAIWLGETNKLVYSSSPSNEQGQLTNQPLQLKIYDVNNKSEQVIETQLPNNASIIGTSKDGNWVYYTSR